MYFYGFKIFTTLNKEVTRLVDKLYSIIFYHLIQNCSYILECGSYTLHLYVSYNVYFFDTIFLFIFSTPNIVSYLQGWAFDLW